MWTHACMHADMCVYFLVVCAHEELRWKWAAGLTSQWSDSETRWPVSLRQALSTPRAVLTAPNLWLLNISPQAFLLSSPPMPRAGQRRILTAQCQDVGETRRVLWTAGWILGWGWMSNRGRQGGGGGQTQWNKSTACDPWGDSPFLFCSHNVFSPNLWW